MTTQLTQHTIQAQKTYKAIFYFTLPQYDQSTTEDAW